MKNSSFERLLLRIYGSKKSGASPLDLPKSSVRILFVISFVLAIILSNAFLRLLHFFTLRQLENTALTVSFAEDNLAEGVRKLLPPDLQKKVRAVDRGQYPEIAELLNDTTITFEEANIYLQEIIESNKNFNRAVAGDITQFLFFIPKFELIQPSEILGEDKKPQTMGSKLEQDNLKRSIAIGLINKFRKPLTAKGYFTSRRLTQAFGGYIQFITFVLAIWGLLLIQFRQGWCNLQNRVISQGHLAQDASRNQQVWDFLHTPVNEKSLLSDYREKYGDSFVVMRLLGDAIEMKSQNLDTSAKSFVNDRIDLMEATVQKGEYQLIDYINYAVPNLGFIGTILGIIMSMANVVQILESSGQLDMVEAFEKVGGSLGLAFDTTFVSLFWVLILSYLLARLQKNEADMFESLRDKSTLFLKYYWQPIHKVK